MADASPPGVATAPENRGHSMFSIMVICPPISSLNNAVDVLNMRKNVVSDKLKQITDYLITNAANVD